MRNATRNTTKKPESATSASGSGDTSALRRSTRGQPQPQPVSSPNNLRKSQRLQKLGVERPPVKKLVSKNTGSKVVGPEGSKKKRGLKEINEEDMTLKDIVKVARDSSPIIGKRVNARLFKAKASLAANNDGVETKSKKRKLESSFENAGSGVGESSEGVSGNGGGSVDSNHLKSVEEIEVQFEEEEDGDSPEEGLVEDCNKDVVDIDTEEIGGETPECIDGEKMEEGSAIGNDGCIENPSSDLKKSLVVDKPCETDNGEAQLASKGSNIPSQAATSIQDEKTSMNGLVGEVKKFPNQAVDGSRCSETEPKLAAVVDGGEGTCKIGSFKEGCVKCSDKPRSDADSSTQTPCGCVSNSMGGVGLISVSKDRGECSGGQKTTKSDFLHEAREPLSTLGEQDTQRNPELAVPHRLLSRRSVSADSQDSGLVSKSHHEWLVKWRGLAYDKATWEVENDEFLKRPEVQQLIQEYKTRHDGAKSSVIFGDNKAQERRNISHIKHGRILDSYRAESTNKLREFYQKNHNAVLLEEQDRMTKVIYFISSILSSTRRPFLIITPHDSLLHWEMEFLRFTTSINVVVYSGNAHSREIIRNLEIYGDDSKLMFQVLISSEEATIEDLEHIQSVAWEVIIVDDCQEPSILGDSGYIKTLSTNWKLLLLNGQRKDTTGEYIKMLSLLETVGSSASNEDINALKARLSSFIVYPRFQEYWVPVDISNVQLEQYCSVMLSNSGFLRQCSKSDPTDFLHNILISMQKCCDHPYIVNPLLRKLLLPEHHSQDAALDMGVKSSGKLQLLDKLLSEFRNQRLKVVILFQSIGGSGKDNLEFLLDDLLTWRFGKDSFEYIAAGGQPSKKNAALSKFNKESDVFFLLLETRACLPSIKLSLVDSVIILNSDWNPLNELRALQKIVIDSKLKPIKVFRFYCSCTVEEKALIMAKSDTILDNTVPINPSTKQMLLMWGSSYLFSRLEEFHRDKVFNYKDNVASGLSFVEDVFQEIVSLVKNDVNVKTNKYVCEALLDERYYLRTTLLIGEQRNQVEKGASSYTFWTELLEGKQPQWKYLSDSSERNRKRVRYSELSSPNDFETDEPVKKRRDSSPQKAGRPPDEDDQGYPDTNIGLSEQDSRSPLHDQRSLFEMLKPTILRLCDTLMLKDGVKRLAERFLEYVVNNHRVLRQPESILQAFQISVCWTAAEVLEKHIDHKKSLDIAIEKMNFKCLKQEADSVNGKMKMLMKIFLSRNLKIVKPSTDPASAINDGSRVPNKSCVNISSSNRESIAIGCSNEEVCSPSQMTSKEKDCHGSLVSNRSCENISSSNQESIAIGCSNKEVKTIAIGCSNKEVSSPAQMTGKEKDCQGDVEKVENHCENKLRKLEERQNVELLKFEKDWLEKKAQIEASYKVESAIIRYSHAKSTDVAEKLKILENDYAKKREGLESQKSDHRKEIEARQQEERDVEQRKIVHLSEELKPVVHDKQLEKLPSENSKQLQVDAPEERNFGCEASVRKSPILSTDNVENPLNGDVTSQVPDKSRAGSENVKSAHSVDNEPTVQGTAAGNFVGEETCDLGSSIAQDHGNEMCQQRVEGAEEQVRPLIESCLDRTNSNPSTHPPDGRTSVLPPTDQNRSASSSQLHIQQNEVQTTVQNVLSQMQRQIPQLGVIIPPVNASIHQGVSNVTPVRGASSARASHSNPTPVISQVPPFYVSDPLQNEFERIRKQIGGVINAHEDEKMRLKSECNKEIEECVAEIRRKYSAELEKAESSFADRKNELELNQKLLMMNKFLADSFRSKCADFKAESPEGIQEVSHRGTPSTVPNRTPPQPHTQAINPSQIPSSSVQSTRPPHMRSSYGGSNQTRPPGPHQQHPSNNNLSWSSHQPPPPPQQPPGPHPHQQHPSNNNLSRPPHQPPPPPQQPPGPHPHQQHPSNNLSRPSHQPPPPPQQPPGPHPHQQHPSNNNLSRPSHQPPPPPQQPPGPHQQHPSNNNVSRPYNQPPPSTQQPPGVLDHSQFHIPPFPLSATELLMEISRQNDSNIHKLSNNQLPLPDNYVKDQEAWDSSQFGTEIDVQQPAEDVVCLSDDE